MEDLRVCKGVFVHGTVFSEHLNTDVSEEEFNIALLEMCVERGWLFGGYTEEITDEDE